MRSFSFITVVSCIVFTVLLQLLVTACREQDQSLPNIIFIMADDLGYNDLASYGQELFPTPHTDRLAREGIRFTDAHSPCAVCSPTRYGVVTGTDPFRRYHTSHVLFNGEPLVIGQDEETVASLLKKAGYRTAVIGKWHLGLGDSLPRDLNDPGRGPNDIGFDYSFVGPDGHDMPPKYFLENGNIVGKNGQVYESVLKINRRKGYYLLRHEEKGEWENLRPNEEISANLAEKADAFIRDCKDGPFFLYYPTHAVHLPFTPGSRFVGKSGISKFADFVMEFDWQVGRIMETLDNLGLTDNTLLIVTSDNGGLIKPPDDAPRKSHDSTHPWSGKKASALEGGHRIPMICRWPGRIKPGSTTDETVSLVDLTATACAIASVPLQSGDALDSHNLLPVLKGRTGGEGIRPYTVMGTRATRELVLRQGPWKLIYAPEQERMQLYRLDADTAESNDLSTTEPAKAAELRSLLEEYFTSGSSRPDAIGREKTFGSYFSERDERNRKIDSLVH